MKKYLYLSILLIAITPYLAYSALQAIEPNDPDIVYVNEPSLFAAKWRKVSSSENFSEYIDPKRIEKNLNSTVDIVTMRNYLVAQVDEGDNKSIRYKSHVSHETIDCFNQTITVNKMYLLSDHFAGGSLVDDPVEPPSRPIYLKPYTVGLSKVIEVCSIASTQTDSHYIKSSFMNNI